MSSHAWIKWSVPAFLGICVLGVFLFPAAAGPFSTVRGPAAEIRSPHHVCFFVGIDEIAAMDAGIRSYPGLASDPFTRPTGARAPFAGVAIPAVLLI